MPLYWRDGEPMHEVHQNGFHAQAYSGAKGSKKPMEQQLRLDYAFRLWGLGIDEYHERNVNGEKKSREEYNKSIYAPWRVWEEKGHPCFGLP